MSMFKAVGKFPQKLNTFQKKGNCCKLLISVLFVAVTFLLHFWFFLYTKS